MRNGSRSHFLHSSFCVLRSSFIVHRFAFLLLSLLTLALFLPPLLRNHVFVLRDHLDYFQPLRFFTASELRAGRIPYWNPYNASGEPWLANPQTGVFYPPAWLLVVLPFATAYMLFLLLHVLLLGLGAYLFFARKASQGAALAGAVALMFSGPVLSLLDINNNLATLAWIPLALWCAAEGAWRRGAFALALAFLGGEPFFAAIGALLYVVIRRNRDVVWTALGAFGLSAIQLLPFLDLLRGSDRAARLDATTILRDSMPLRDWLRIAVPPTLNSSAFDAHLGQHFLPAIYLGIAVVAIALAGIRKQTLGWLALLAIVAIVASGPAWLASMPLTLFRYPARVVPFGALAVAALFVAGWERIRAYVLPNKRWVDLLLVLIVLADLVPRMQPLFASAPFNPHPLPYARAVGGELKVLRVGEIEPRQRTVWMSGYLNLYDRRFDVSTAAPVVSDAYARMYRQLLEHPSHALLDRISAGWLLSKVDLTHSFARVGSIGGVSLFRNAEAWPLAVLVDGRVIRGVMVELDTQRARVVVDTPHPSYVMLTQQRARGWTLTFDGTPAEDSAAYGMFRGFRVPRGHHELLWTYRPPLLHAGALLTLVTLVAMFVKRSRA
ncbi:MAG: hypothetical protein JO197_11305 [Acidobacteria bacterium]|nr:hypothetical protein [Acidobacteriota bacterium]MBV9476062.1 hypothetical protein [Acidobacteriota bacterium]